MLTAPTGVMRFLQTEWHRHERDRNGWEIERQEMKGRIARLEGSTRKSDASDKSLKKYINMLEKALKERDSQVKALKAGSDVVFKDSIRESKEKQSLAVKKERRKFQWTVSCDVSLTVFQLHKSHTTRSWTPKAMARAKRQTKIRIVAA